MMAQDPGALVEHVRALVRIAEEQLAQKAVVARDLVARANAALADPEHGWHEAGSLLRQLKEPALASSLGHRSFGALVAAELGLGTTTTHKMLRLSAALTPEQAAGLGLDRADALLSLHQAVGGNELEAILAGQSIVLWSGGPTLIVRDATLAALQEAAKSARAHAAASGSGAGAPRPRRGRQVGLTERSFVDAVNAELRGLGSQVAVRAKATRAGRPSSFALEGLQQEECGLAVGALLAALRASRHSA